MATLLNNSTIEIEVRCCAAPRGCKSYPSLFQKLNSAHGSVGMFQIISTRPTLDPLPRALRAGGNELLLCREDLKHPPTCRWWDFRAQPRRVLEGSETESPTRSVGMFQIISTETDTKSLPARFARRRKRELLLCREDLKHRPTCRGCVKN